MKSQLDKSIDDQINSTSVEARKLWLEGKIDDAAQKITSAWEMLPAPRTNWGRSLQLARGISEFYLKNGRFSEARKWSDVMAECAGDPKDSSVAVHKGVIEFEAGIPDAAIKNFRIAYDQFKDRPFQGKDPKYLKFFKEHLKGEKA